MDDELRNEIMSRIDKKYNSPSILKYLEETLNYAHLLTVFRLDSSLSDQTTDIDIAILHSLLKAKNDKFGQLKLALTWNRIDIARKFIFTEDKTWEVCQSVLYWLEKVFFNFSTTQLLGG